MSDAQPHHDVRPPAGGAGADLVMESVSKTFGTQTVLRDVDLHVRPGEVHALVGQNGSGKSTLIKVLAGYHTADAGSRVLIDGEAFDPHHPGASEAAGLRFVHQDLALVGGLSTVENLGLGSGYDAPRGGRVRWAARRRAARAALAELGYRVDVDLPVAQLAASERTAVAVARALSHHHSPPRALVLDEPTANFPGPEVDRLFDLVRLVRDRGLAILFVTHHLSEVFRLADRVTVLRGGELVTTRPVTEFDEATLIEHMVGRELAVVTAPAPAPREDTVLEVADLGGAPIQGLDLRVAAGEIVGVAGITGSGREAVAGLVFGGSPRTGTVSVGGVPVPAGDPVASIRHGIALVPADRAANAVLDGHDLTENMTVVELGRFSHHGRLRRGPERAESRRWIGRLDIRPAEPRAPIATLSGGNAQKVMLARWLRLDPKVLVLDEPTQGVDVGAKADIYRLVRDAAERGCAVLVCSTDSEELAWLSHRVVVLGDGRVVAELAGPLEPDEITRATLAAPARRVGADR